jgi:hypothetical protein
MLPILSGWRLEAGRPRLLASRARQLPNIHIKISAALALPRLSALASY